MPKRIENLREKILKSSRKILLESGYDSLNMRDQAQRCGIAVGTLYNYFPSKEMLAASVILEDWQKELHTMQTGCEEAGSMRAGLEILYRGIKQFNDTYHSVWANYVPHSDQRCDYTQRHQKLVQQLASCITPVLKRFQPDVLPGTDIFLAENVLICAGNSEMTFDIFLPIAEKLFTECLTAE